MTTYYVVQTYSVDRSRKIQPDEPRQARSEAEAKRLAERLSERMIGVVAFSRTGDPTTGDWEDAQVIYQAGNFPREDAEALALSA